MLFRKKIERSCAYCVHGAVLEDGVVLCAKKGMKTVDFTQYASEDCSH